MEEQKNLTPEKEETINPVLEAFLDMPTLYEKTKVLKDNFEQVDDHVINACAASLDVVLRDGTKEERLRELLECLETMKRFEVGRLY